MNVVILISFVLFSSSLSITVDECLQHNQTEQGNLNLVLSFYQETFGQLNVNAVDEYISNDFIEHNPIVPEGHQEIKDFLVTFNANKVKGPVDIRHTSVNGDMVWLHLKTTGLRGEPLAIVDIFRVKDCKIVEHWDVIQEIPSIAESKNLNQMF